MKILALNLPAFHQIPENDEWWGEGFTEWDNVKGGKPLYKNHYQPIKPLNNNYYDLSHKEDIINQITLAKKYDVHGFVYYHYWFGNGRVLFDKPIKILRDEIDVDFNYCLCWANDTWITTWHGLEPKTLIEQLYPGKDDWAMHYDYLSKYFYDKRYIKVDNKPMLFIYQAHKIPNYDSFIDYFNERCREDGFDGIYVVEYISSKCRELCSGKTSAVFEFEPHYTTFFDISKFELGRRFICKKLKMLDFQSYDKLWKYIITRNRTYSGKPIIRGCFVGWDNSARKGKDSMIVRGKSPEKFKKYLKALITNKREDASEEYCVINAWNEWSEGAYLEPDDRDGFKYLEAIKDLNKIESKEMT
ncbi:MAG: glycoside hydrolase family 99-like domain-containing protein [Lachnospiraceae bacterium]|nr:glycoside hydrolase family 99-like domain-containing protein [Lachnospiraceae bacterium]